MSVLYKTIAVCVTANHILLAITAVHQSDGESPRDTELAVVVPCSQ
jgi:hypothetical protein